MKSPVLLVLLLCMVLVVEGDIFPLIEMIHKLKTHIRPHNHHTHFGRRRNNLVNEMGKWVHNLKTQIEEHNETQTIVPSEHLPHHLHHLWHQFHNAAWKGEKILLKEIAKIEEYIRRGVSPGLKDRLEGILVSLKQNLENGD